MKILKLWELTILLKDDRFEEFKVPMDVINRTLDLKNFINMIFNFMKERTSFNRMYIIYLHIIDPFFM
jgi:hypothetical protein